MAIKYGGKVMKKFIQITTALLLCAVFFFVIAAPYATFADDGNVYNIRVAVGKQYCGEAVVKAGDVLNAQLEAEGSKDRVNVEFLVLDSLIDSFTIFSREGTMPELAVDSISGLRDIVEAGYTINNDFVINDAYGIIGLNSKDSTDKGFLKLSPFLFSLQKRLSGIIRLSGRDRGRY